MTVEQFKRVRTLERSNAALMAERAQREREAKAEEQVQRWRAEGEEVKAKYPGFDLDTECLNPEFLSMLRHGVPMAHAFEVLHLDDLMRETAANTERAVVENVRARGARVSENGTQPASSFTLSSVKEMSKAERAQLANRAMRGEKITL